MANPYKVVFATSRAIEPLIKAKGFIHTKIITDWAAIVGEDLAKFSLPAKIKQDLNKKHVLTIDITNGAKATEFAYIHDFILERINTYFGYAAIASIKVQQTPKLNNQSTTPNTVKLDHEQQVKLQNATDNIDDESLQQALYKLGEMVFTNPK